MLIFLTRRRTAAEFILRNSGIGDRIGIPSPADPRDPLQIDEVELRRAVDGESEDALVTFLEFLAKHRSMLMIDLDDMTDEHAKLAAIAFGIANGTFVADVERRLPTAVGS